jgi:hypothetical protein
MVNANCATLKPIPLNSAFMVLEELGYVIKLTLCK